MTQERQNSGAQADESLAEDSGEKATADELTRLYAVLMAAREYIAAVKQPEKGSVGRAWAQLVKTVRACEVELPT